MPDSDVVTRIGLPPYQQHGASHEKCLLASSKDSMLNGSRLSSSEKLADLLARMAITFSIHETHGA